MKLSLYSSTITSFRETSVGSIYGDLSSNTETVEVLQRNAWLEQIVILQKSLLHFEGWISFEFSIPRMGRRTDVILIIGGIVFILEFKVGTQTYDRAAIEQVTDYALDLKNFHLGSHDIPIVPILVATKASYKENVLQWHRDHLSNVLLCNAEGISTLLKGVLDNSPKHAPLDGETWANSGYRPTPTIIEAAQALYQGHAVTEITRFDAGKKNLKETNDCLSRIIEDAKRTNSKCICVVTGVPGAGKTLAGLNLVTDRTKVHEDEHAVFLSGNGPLVDVLREALARDEHTRNKATGLKTTKSDATRKVRSFIQNIHHFRDAYLVSSAAPLERVVVFDEAQRAWDRQHASKFMAQKRGLADFNMSEPEYLISVMDRHEGWCVIVCLVGGGQEINAGEAGLTEWLTALRTRFSSWNVFMSPQLTHKDYHWGQSLHEMLHGLNVKTLAPLHLGVSIRSYRAEKLSLFVGAVIDGDLDTAQSLYNEIKSAYPIHLTRNLSDARNWLRNQARGSERTGLVCSSGASRLKPEGLNVHEKINSTNWFLNTSDDVRSSYYLEDPATEFDIQGLEVDWVGVCWDADLRYVDGQWQYRQFRGTAWQQVNNNAAQKYLCNAYRVLMTRARQGMCIYVPMGSPDDVTRSPAYYDGTYDFLREILQSA